MKLLVQTDDGLNNFAALRLAMALLVIWSHSFALALPQGEAAEPISMLTNGHYNAGNIGVMAFFVISGFLISESYLNSSSTLRFFIKRVRRIYPGYLVATTICALVIVPLFSTGYLISPVEMGKTLCLNLMLRGYFPPSDVFAGNYSQTVNGSLWSIPYEFWCYVAVAVLGALGLLKKRPVIVSIIVFSISTKVLLDALGKKPGLGMIGSVFGWPYLWLSILPCFFVGTIFFLLKDQIPRSRFILSVLLVCFFAACYAPAASEFQNGLTEVLFPIAMAYTVFYFSFSGTIRMRRADAYGDFSYGTYLFAFPIQQMILSTSGHSLAFPALVFWSIILSVGAGAISWHLVEKWFLPKKKNALDRACGLTLSDELEPLG
jgi:peptidoglycan/LPS O-acetylase OafA/YrhL